VFQLYDVLRFDSAVVINVAYLSIYHPHLSIYHPQS